MTFYKLQVQEYTVWLYFKNANVKRLITEARDRGINLTGPYSYLEHGPHTAQGQQHLHVYKKNNQLFAINRDGTAHDKSHGYRIPNKVADALSGLFPDWTMPKNKIIEGSSGDLTQILVEIFLSIF